MNAVVTAVFGGLLIVVIGWLKLDINRMSDTVSADVSRLADKIDRMDERINDRFDHVEERITSLVDRVAHLEGRP
jgi:hypothetical protein